MNTQKIPSMKSKAPKTAQSDKMFGFKGKKGLELKIDEDRGSSSIVPSK